MQAMPTIARPPSHEVERLILRAHDAVNKNLVIEVEGLLRQASQKEPSILQKREIDRLWIEWLVPRLDNI